ncbi:MAG: ATP-binding protein [Myxococcota bacterium]|nr:ATP-binding protein [Myxococcota bacterium]
MSTEPVSAWMAYESSDSLERVSSCRPGDLRITRAWSIDEEPPDLERCSMLVLEQSDLGPATIARVQSFATAGPDLLVVVLPRGAPAALEIALREAGAFDVVEDGPELDRAIARTVAMARHVLRLHAERTKLTAGLAHNERLSAIGLLAAGVGHEINNPSTAILANAERLRSELESLLSRPRLQQAEVLQHRASEWLEGLGDCIAASRRITSIVRALNVFSRRSDENARAEPAILNEDIATVLRLVGKEVRFQAHVELELDPDLPYVVAPPHAMTQVITNLVVNALQALEAKEYDQRRLRVTTSHDEDTVFLEVADNGLGIPADTIARIFDPFFTTKEVGVGTGLGLSITRELVRRAGGEIFVESEPGFGSCFRVVLPRPARVESRPRPLSAAPPGHGRLRVLIVDDDEMLLRAITNSLAEDFECTSVASGKAALELVQKAERFDVLLSDVVMPGMDGLRLYQQLADIDPALAERTVFFSGGLRSQTLEHAIVGTGRPLIAKPISMRDLARRLREAAAA